MSTNPTKRIEEIDRRLEELPKGTLTYKKIKGKEGDVARAKEIIRAKGIQAAGKREGRKAQGKNPFTLTSKAVFALASGLDALGADDFLGASHVTLSLGQSLLNVHHPRRFAGMAFTSNPLPWSRTNTSTSLLLASQ